MLEKVTAATRRDALSHPEAGLIDVFFLS